MTPAEAVVVGRTSVDHPGGSVVPGGRRLGTSLYNGLKRQFLDIKRFSQLHDRYNLEDRRRDAPVLICVLAGYKPDLWPYVFPLLKAALPAADVCLVSPGLWNRQLSALCRDEGWSYLSTATNDVSLAQNVCFRLHPAASMVVKLDEDMFLLPNTIHTLLAEYAKVKTEGHVQPGFVAPMIPLNGFCYRDLLVRLGMLGDYEANFGIARIATSGIAVQSDPSAAVWIWQRTGPLSAVAERLLAVGVDRLLCPIQFSIGLVVFERKFWEDIGMLPVYRRRLLIGANTLGGDEAHICARAFEMSRPIVVTTATVAGHFSFGPQYEAMKALLRHTPEIFSPGG